MEHEHCKFYVERFLYAQDNPPVGCGTYESALEEMKRGYKRGHWVWYVFPQIEGFVHSAMTKKYGLSGMGEAIAYLGHPELNRRMHKILEAMFTHVKPGMHGDIISMMGSDVDAWKFRSSMTIFWCASRKRPETPDGDPIFKRAIDVFCWGSFDDKTLAMLKDPNKKFYS